MARGNRREDIVRDDTDRMQYEQLWREAVKMTGWKVYAWILMNNHYHAVIETPEPNLVEGMKWIQNTWTRRFNSRHKVWGHLFGGRYKSILCEEGKYLQALIDYVHLNPVRAKMIHSDEQLESYQWSSLNDYVLPVRKRRKWLSIGEGLAHFDLEDSALGRRKYLQRLNNHIDWNRPKQSGLVRVDEQSLNSTLRRGWYFGAESYREKALKYIEQLKKKKKVKYSPQSGYSVEQSQDHGQAQAEEILAKGLAYYELQETDLAILPKGDLRKVVIAALIREHTTVRLSWISELLKMGVSSRVSAYVNQMNRTGSNKKERREILASHK
jgi:REP element-mobilizing transposase RayT